MIWWWSKYAHSKTPKSCGGLASQLHTESGRCCFFVFLLQFNLSLYTLSRNANLFNSTLLVNTNPKKKITHRWQFGFSIALYYCRMLRKKKETQTDKAIESTWTKNRWEKKKIFFNWTLFGTTVFQCVDSRRTSPQETHSSLAPHFIPSLLLSSFIF